MHSRPPSTPADRAAGAALPFGPGRWEPLARALGLAPAAPLVLALSGGADSVYLLQLLSRAEPRPELLAVHVDHGLRGAESEADAEFCMALCRRLAVPFVRRRVALDPEAQGLEERARVARYRALCEEAARAGIGVIATGHHADDVVETLLLRWLRGTDAAGAHVPARTELRPGQDEAALNPTRTPLLLVRPLLALRREEVRTTLLRQGLEWREDSSNARPEFARNRLRNVFLPLLSAACGPEASTHLARFGSAVEEFERQCARLTAAVAWRAPRHALARRAADERRAGGALERAELERLIAPLQRRALVRLLAEGTGRFDRRVVIDDVLATLRSGATGDWVLAGGWRLGLHGGWLELDPPPRRRSGRPGHAGRAPVSTASTAHQRQFDFAAHEDGPWALAVPGTTTLPDGRRLSAEWVEVSAASALPHGAGTVELDAHDLAGPLAVRWPRSGDRFRPLGGPGSKRLTRFLRDAGIPRHDRGRVALVCNAEEVLWVAGLRPSETRRVHAGTRRRLRLSVTHA